MSETTIVELEKLLKPKYKKIIKYETENLVEPGENYGSVLLALKLTIEEDNAIKIVNLVAKLVPDNEFYRKIYQSELTFTKELQFYQTIIPTLQKFQIDNNVEILDCFPKFIAGRIGLQQEFDNNATIILENLHSSNYENVDKTIGFNFETSKSILGNLARLHGSVIALRENREEEFHKIQPILKPLLPFIELYKKMKNKFANEILGIIKEKRDYQNYLGNFNNILLKHNCVEDVDSVECFKSLSICDFWANNIMVKDSGSNKFIDFQLCSYGSVTHDVTFFIFTSTQNQVIVEKFDELVDGYYECFIETLRKFKVDLTKFTKEELMEDMGRMMGGYGLTRSLSALRGIFANKENVLNVKDVSLENLGNKGNVSQLHKDRLWIIVKECIKRKWVLPD